MRQSSFPLLDKSVHEARFVSTPLFLSPWVRGLSAMILWIACSEACLASGLATLDVFLQGKDRGRLSFSQTTVRRVFDGTPRQLINRGTLEFIRPDRWRMEYASPGEVVVVADGTSVLVYEAPLSLTTVHSQKEVVSQAINLLLGARSVGELSGIYDLREVVDKDVDWAILTPKEAQMEWLKKISLGFERGDLSKVEVDTSAGERLLFQLNWLAADQVEMSRFIFAPPAGSDIVDKSAKP